MRFWCEVLLDAGSECVVMCKIQLRHAHFLRYEAHAQRLHLTKAESMRLHMRSGRTCPKVKPCASTCGFHNIPFSILVLYDDLQLHGSSDGVVFLPNDVLPATDLAIIFASRPSALKDLAYWGLSKQHSQTPGNLPQ